MHVRRWIHHLASSSLARTHLVLDLLGRERYEAHVIDGLLGLLNSCARWQLDVGVRVKMAVDEVDDGLEKEREV